MQKNSKFNGYQLVIFMIYSILGVGLLHLPSALTDKVGNEAYLVIIVECIIALVVLFLICLAGSVYNNDGLVGTSKRIYGKTIGILLVLPLLIYLFIVNIIEIRIFSITIKMFLLEKTPENAIIIPIFLLIMLLIRGEFRHISRFGEFVIPFLLILVVVISMLTIPGADFSELLPVFQREPGEYLKAIQTGIFTIMGTVNLLVAIPYFKNTSTKKAFKTAAMGIIITISLYMLITILCIAKLGTSETKWLIYPTISLIKSAYIPGGFIERLEGLLMSSWVVVVFITISISIYIMAILVSDIFKFKHTKLVVTIIIPIIYASYKVLGSIVEATNLAKITDITIGIYSMVVLPILIYVGHRVKSRRGGI
ncbi:MAG: endospore germination permease [Clostridium sp.]